MEEGTLQALATLWRLPLLYLTVLGVRGLCILLLNPLFKLVGTGARRAKLHMTHVYTYCRGQPCAKLACCSGKGLCMLTRHMPRAEHFAAHRSP